MCAIYIVETNGLSGNSQNISEDTDGITDQVSRK